MQSEENGFAPFHFAVLTDPHLLKRGTPRLESAITQINARDDLSFVLILGDFVWAEPITKLKALLSRIRIPYHVVLGNHDAGRIQEYEAEFGPLYGAFEYRDCLFIGLWNAIPALHEPAARDGDMDGEQETWAVQTLRRARERDRRIFIYTHIPPRAPGEVRDPDFRMRTALSDKFYQWCREFSVDACLFGHVHYDEVFESGGTQFITTPSLIWNLEGRDDGDVANWTKTDRGGYRIIHVGAEDLRDEIHWIE
jgi:3',5'-cyclic AMP phosphodiesterase CpdA